MLAPELAAQGHGERSKEGSATLPISRTIFGAFRYLSESIFTTVFPAPCRVCGDPLVNISRLPVCEQCLAAMVPSRGTVCDVCGERLLSPVFAQQSAAPEGAPARCGVCVRYRQPYRRAVAYGSYEGELRELLHLLKYSRVMTAAPVLGTLLAHAMRKLDHELRAVGEPVLVITVPLDRERGRTRGFNQSDVVLRAAMRELARDAHPLPLQFADGVLQRVRRTVSQTGLTRHQRRENLRGAFSVNAMLPIKDRSVVLVDDVFTTGTTIAECARTLKRAGAEEVYAATVARVYKFSAEELDRWNFHGQLTSNGGARAAEQANRAVTSEHPKG